MEQVKKLVPKRRFKEFQNAEAWEERKLGDDIVSIQTGTNLLGSTSNKGKPLLKMGNIQRGYFSFDKLEKLNINEEVEPENIAHYGDFLFNTRNTLELVGKGATWVGISGVYAFNSNLARFVFKNIDTIFFNYLYNTTHMIRQVNQRAMGTTSVAAVYPRTLSSVKYRIPTLPEQKKIGALLNQLDNLITLHQRKLDKIKSMKKAYLYEMFPAEGESKPKRRFKGFTDDWEKRKLGEIVTIKSGVSPSLFESGNELYIKVNDLNNSFREQVESKMKVALNPKWMKIKKGSVIFPKRGAAIMTNKVRILQHSGYMDTNMMALEPEDIYSEYLYLFISKTGLYKIADTSTIPQINNKHIEPYEIDLPEFEEQKRIAEYFRQLDNLITLHQQKLDKLKNLKKSYLNEMFI